MKRFSFQWLYNIDFSNYYPIFLPPHSLPLILQIDHALHFIIFIASVVSIFCICHMKYTSSGSLIAYQIRILIIHGRLFIDEILFCTNSNKCSFSWQSSQYKLISRWSCYLFCLDIAVPFKFFGMSYNYVAHLVEAGEAISMRVVWILFYIDGWNDFVIGGSYLEFFGIV